MNNQNWTGIWAIKKTDTWKTIWTDIWKIILNNIDNQFEQKYEQSIWTQIWRIKLNSIMNKEVKQKYEHSTET